MVYLGICFYICFLSLRWTYYLVFSLSKRKSFSKNKILDKIKNNSGYIFNFADILFFTTYYL